MQINNTQQSVKIINVHCTVKKKICRSDLGLKNFNVLVVQLETTLDYSGPYLKANYLEHSVIPKS